MARQLGRISGPLLQENLLRNGANLSFSNDRTNPASIILHLDVNTNRIGINNSSPTRDLSVNDTVGTTTLESQLSSIDNLDFSEGTIENLIGNVNFVSASSVQVPRLKTADIEINDNNIQTYTPNTNLNLSAFSNENVILNSNTQIDNDLDISGNTTIIDANATNIEFENASISKDITVNKTAQFENIKIDQNVISTTISNSAIELSPGGAGTLEIFSNTNVDGNIHATGNITFIANTIFGDENTDVININSEIIGNIVPETNGLYNLGSEIQKWTEVKARLLNGIDIDSAAVAVDNVDIGESQGNVFYVAVNGSNSNRGDHQQGPWASIKYALEQADASTGGPVTIYVYPGEYEEELPLYVPPNTTVKGLDLRNTIIKPDTTSQSEDVFLLDGESTVEDLTIMDFYYDSVNDKGYAFRFAEIASTPTLISRRSPYIRNVTVITHGSVTSISDPRGFDAGDAGRGALIDGQYVDSASLDASMLFHSCTFITPNAIAITMRNGVRVEWLNCFTYFANIGLYAVNGALGRLTNDGSTVRRGAEIRSIGSANVYGNYGAVADGDETLMYLIGHNFAYIGTGKDSSNDTTLVLDANQTVEYNSGKIYYTKTDERGNYDVGDAFFVDFDTGTTSLTGTGVDLTGVSSISINTGGSETFIDASKIETGNIRISGNTIQSLSGPIIWESASGEINVTGTVNASENVSITGNLTTQGLTTIGNQVTDTVEFDAELTSSIIPNTNDTYNLGTLSKRWNTVWLSQIDNDQITINDNIITSNDSNVNLELRANGTGDVVFISDVDFDQDVQVSGLTNFKNVNLFDIDYTGTVTQTGSYNQTGYTFIAGSLTTDRQIDIENIRIDGNYITTSISDSDLELRANNTGLVSLPNNNLVIDNNFTVNSQGNMQNVIVTNSAEFSTAELSGTTRITSNTITTINSSSDLELRSTKNISIPTNNVEIDNNLTVNGQSNLQNLDVVGSLTLVGNSIVTGNITHQGQTNISGNLLASSTVLIEDIEINDNYISTTSSNADIEIRANSTGLVRFQKNTIIDNDFTVNGTISANDIVVATSLDLNDLVVLNNIKIDDNFITTTVSNSNLELRADGLGKVELQDLLFDNNVLSTSASDIVIKTDIYNLEISSTDALIVPVGLTTQRNSQQGDIRFNTNFGLFEGYATSNVVFNGVYSSNFLTRARVNDTDNILRFDINNVNRATITDSVNVQQLQIDDININGNTVSTNVSNSDIDIATSGTGKLNLYDLSLKTNTITSSATATLLKTTGFGSVRISGTGAVILTAGDTSSRRSNPQTGEFRFNTDDNIAEVYNGTEWVAATGPAGDVVSAELMGEIVDEWSLILG